MPTDSVEHPLPANDTHRWEFIYKRGIILDPRRLATLVNGIFSSWFLATMLLFVLLVPASDQLTPFVIAMPSLVFAPCVFGLGGPLLWLYWHRRPKHMDLLFERDIRRERLRRIVQDKSNVARVPHRFVEWAYRRTLGSQEPPKRVVRKRLRTILPAMAPQTIVIVGRKRGEHFLQPQRTTFAFEPVASNDRSGCKQFVASCFENMGVNPLKYDMTWSGMLRFVDPKGPLGLASYNLERREMREGKWETFKKVVLLCAVLALFLWVLGIAFIIVKYVVLQLLFGSERYAMLRRLGFVVCVVCAVLGIRLLIGRKTWLVPGGLLVHRHPFWRRRGTVRYCRCMTSPLVVDVSASRAYFVHKGSVLAGYGGWPMLAAWVSRARPPTEEEVRTFIGTDAEYE